MDDHCDCHKTRVRSEEELKKLCNRLSRIEGQVRGLREILRHISTRYQQAPGPVLLMGAFNATPTSQTPPPTEEFLGYFSLGI